jgi:ATP phosphoribosyltransferase regulatory subunit
MHTWLLPEYLEDILPPQAAAIERARRIALDAFASQGYELVIPPLMEYLESLLTGTGRDMEIDTFKLVDQLSGRLMGVRADITPQAARIDAHLLNRQGVTRLCYAGPVLHTRPGNLQTSREPLQVGAELFGHAGLEADLEVQKMLLSTLKSLGVAALHLDLGHVGIFRALMNSAQADQHLESELFHALQAKDVPAIADLTHKLPAELRAALLALPTLYGQRAVLARAAQVLPKLPEIGRALDALETLADDLASCGAELYFDLAELRGYHYHNGVVFAAYAQGSAYALAHGGRYDNVGQQFGRARCATGFSLDLRALAPYLQAPAGVPGILAPYGADPALAEKIAALRSAGQVVVVELPGQEAYRAETRCDRRLVLKHGVWEVEKN